MTFFAALRTYVSAHQLLRQPAFRRFLWLPGVISLVYMALLVIVGQSYIESGVAYIAESWVPAFMQGALVGFFLNLLLWLLLLVGILLTYRPVVLTILAPLLGVLSERVEQTVRPGLGPELGAEAPAAQVVHDLGRAAVVNGYSLFWSLLLSLLAWLVGFLPLVGALVAPPLLFLIQAYYSAIGLADPSLERLRYSVRATLGHARQHRAAMLGLGSGFMLMLMIPVLGWFLAPTYGTVAATLLTLDLVPEASGPSIGNSEALLDSPGRA